MKQIYVQLRQLHLVGYRVGCPL
uniref:Uncharacterized protein n=1 Tax=Arundo donax TaxID=35708 RepID=A0A0A9H5S1_ARUDO